MPRNYQVYMPPGKRVYNVYMPSGKRVYNAYLPPSVTCQTPNLFPPGFSNPIPWFSLGSSILTENATTSPDGQNDGAFFQIGPADFDDRIAFVQTTFGTADADLEFRCWIKRISTVSGILMRNVNPVKGIWSIDLSLLSDDWEELTTTHPAITESAPWQIESDGSFEFNIERAAGPDQTLQFYMWCFYAQEI